MDPILLASLLGQSGVLAQLQESLSVKNASDDSSLLRLLLSAYRYTTSWNVKLRDLLLFPVVFPTTGISVDTEAAVDVLQSYVTKPVQQSIDSILCL